MAAGERVKPAWYCTAPVLSCQKEAAMNYKGYKHIRWEQRLKIEGGLCSWDLLHRLLKHDLRLSGMAEEVQAVGAGGL